MKAILKVINRNRGMYAAEIDGNGEFVVFELLDSCELEVGDVISTYRFLQYGRRSL